MEYGFLAIFALFRGTKKPYAYKNFFLKFFVKRHYLYSVQKKKKLGWANIAKTLKSGFFPSSPLHLRALTNSYSSSILLT